MANLRAAERLWMPSFQRFILGNLFGVSASPVRPPEPTPSVTSWLALEAAPGWATQAQTVDGAMPRKAAWLMNFASPLTAVAGDDQR